MDFDHKPVLYGQVISGLNISSDTQQLFIDGTCGGGGHSYGILDSSDKVNLIAVDKDGEAIDACGKRLQKFSRRVTYLHQDFKAAAKQFIAENLQADGVLLDLGVSSYQLDNYQRGFSYRADKQRLDMRMDTRQQKSAYTVVNEYPQQALADIIYRYGEEKFSRRIAENIVKYREQSPIETSGQLTELIYASIPAAARRTGGNPAKRTYQALRIEVNDELNGLDSAVDDYVKILKPGGRLCIITFHSLEDRIIKQAFKRLAVSCTCPPQMPVCICGGSGALVKVITNKPIVADEAQLSENPRSASAKLRICQKLT